jgi:ribosomal protein L37AE/L43A
MLRLIVVTNVNISGLVVPIRHIAPNAIQGDGMLTLEEQEATNNERRNEVGTEPPCPFCKRPRVARSNYIRCNPCGTNWLDEEMHLPNYLNRNPAAARSEAARMATATKPTANTSVGAAETT